MPSLQELATKGRENYAAKKAKMVKSYAASIGRQNAGYQATPFGPTRKAAYVDSASRRQAHYTESSLDETKWERSWIAKMQE